MVSKRILIMAGGTGGHVFPALAIADALKQKGVEIAWLGTAQGIEARLVPHANIPLHIINVAGLRRNGLIKKLIAPFTLLIALFQACKVIRTFKPQCVIGLGGFASGPGGVAAVLLRVPLLIHEQNAIAGMTNTLLARIANKVMQAFPHTFPARLHPILTGNPVRDSILQLPPPSLRFQTRTGPLHILILGGSGGALILNQHMPDVFMHLPPNFCEVWHQTGKRHFDIAQKRYAENKINAKIEPFIDDMAQAYAWADIVICRAGALTVFELAAAGVGSILIPYLFAVDDHQTKNAHYLVDKNAAILLPQSEFQPTVLATLLKKHTRETLLELANAAYAQRLPHATEDVVKISLNSF
ncbi:MAG: undecaprenyldiphospho-muramoylpentapeptide beta-N-acetylglucosaminyltransferase [Gammaproteobacteria bacterium]|nr:undecaprenyldiphospho-muramoylpentapeptide beta-N-acetylglucosaminyltransferase [Gammaproteobacteria bacterium]